MRKDRIPLEENAALSREERRTTGKVVAVIVALSLILLAMYHAWIRRTAVLAGVIVPALIMVLYTAWVLYSAKRDKYRRSLEANAALNGGWSDVLAMRSRKNEETVSDLTQTLLSPSSAVASSSKYQNGHHHHHHTKPRRTSDDAPRVHLTKPKETNRAQSNVNLPKIIKTDHSKTNYRLINEKKRCKIPEIPPFKVGTPIANRSVQTPNENPQSSVILNGQATNFHIKRERNLQRSASAS